MMRKKKSFQEILSAEKKEAAEEEPTIKNTRRDTTPKEKPVKTTSKITPISKSSESRYHQTWKFA